MPDDQTLRAHLSPLSGTLLHTLAASGPWDTSSAGGEEVDVDWLLEPQRRHSSAAAPARPGTEGVTIKIAEQAAAPAP